MNWELLNIITICVWGIFHIIDTRYLQPKRVEKYRAQCEAIKAETVASIVEELQKTDSVIVVNSDKHFMKVVREVDL